MIFIVLLLISASVLFKTYFLDPRAEAMREKIEMEYGVLQKYERFVQGEQLTEEGVQTVIEEMENIEKRLVDAKSEFLAAATLQEEISDLSAKAGLKIMTIRPMSASKEGSYLNLPVFFEGYGDIRQISGFLQNLESSRYLLKTDKLTINITNVQNPRELKVKIQISGLGRP